MSEIKEEKRKTSAFKIIVIVLLTIIVIGGGSFAGYYILNKDKTNAETEKKIDEVTFPLEEFFVNLADEGGRHYIKANIYLGFEENKKIAKEIEEKTPNLRDEIISVLRSKKTTDFTDKGVDNVKKEIISRVGPLLENANPINVYFYDILIQ